MRIAIQQPALPAYRVPLFRSMTEAMPEHEVTLYYGSEEPELKNAEPVGFKAKLSRFKIWRLPVVGELRWHPIQWQLVDGKSADVVVLSWNIRVVSFWFALLRAQVTKVPVIIWGHGYSKSNTGALANWIRALPVRLASRVMFYDSKTAERFIIEMGNKSSLSPSKVHVAHNGLDSVAIQKVREASLQRYPVRSDAREHLELGEGPVLIYVGRLMQENRLDLAVMSLAAVIKEHPSTKLVVVGSGDGHKNRLEELATAAEVLDHIVFTGAIYSEHELAPWMLAADVFVYPCNVGLSLVHAFNYALPAVLCAPLSEHNPEVAVVDDGVNTVIAYDKTTNALTASILELLDNPEKAHAMGKSALGSVLETHNVVSMSAAFKQAFEAL